MTNQLINDLREARARTLELTEGLTDEQLMGPKLDIVNPLRWEIAHVAYFHELWILRHLDGRDPIIPNADDLYDSINIHHEQRWDLPLLSRHDTLNYMRRVLEEEITRLDDRVPSDKEVYLYKYATYHEDMHTEAFTYSRQTLGYPQPRFALAVDPQPEWDAGALPGDVEIPGGVFMLGASAEEGFCFDNEKWVHPVEVKPFRIARAPVTNADFAEFVEDDGYLRKEFWSEDGWAWCETTDSRKPRYWQRSNEKTWTVRNFDRKVRLKPHAPVIHVNWYEARAWCRWARRRLPSEAEWELAAAGLPTPNCNGVAAQKRRFPWGNQPPAPHLANLDGRAMRCIDVAALPDSDSAFGCRQMIGNVWEWTSDTFNPYPGFTPDMYQDYSKPLFGITKVLRGGAWTTRARMLRNTWRNYYGPHRNDVFAGFRTCDL